VTGITTVAAGSTAAPSITPTGDTDTGIFFPSADTIAFGEGGSEALRIDSSGRVGINSNSPNDYQVDISAPSDRPPLRLYRRRNTSGGGLLDIRSDVGGVDTREFLFSTGGDLTLSTGNLIIGTSGKGIDFSATANSSGTMTSELLSDYEEGTWSPTFIGEGVNPTVTYSLQLGRYVKIGQMVYASGNITLSAVSGTGSSNLQIGGWPFTVGPSATTDRTTVVDVGFANNWTTASPTRGYLREGQTGAYLTTISGTTVTFITTNHLQSTSALYFKIVYTTSA